ncbi:hypothetical protein SADUNF_Sadunf08G0006200 [Salix dunnii]|uniref:Uncharacterized protein n=1 Tax=Salix dunnii TaxID=1413687 RepID=A0A835JWD3_9ROSI|nr:hypothetical protein SADUNF_Sadunf08G0006200 [Salix dunnii]
MEEALDLPGLVQLGDRRPFILSLAEEYFREEGEQEEFAFGHDVLSNDDGHLADDFLQGGSGDEDSSSISYTSPKWSCIDIDVDLVSMDDLKHKLLYTTLELQKMKMKANVTLREQKDTVQHLLNLLANACKERDGARDQLQALLYKSISSRSPGQILSQVQPKSPILNTTPKANISILESNSEAYNQLSHCSSSVDSFFDAGSSPDFPNKNLEGSSTTGLLNQLFVQEQYSWTKFTGLVSSGGNNVQNDRGIAVIDYLAQGKVLPQKGKLLQAVMDAGPLLQSLLITGQLPQWRNPPTLKTPLSILPNSNRAAYVRQKPYANPVCSVLRASNSSPSNNMNHSLQFMSNSTGAPSCSGWSNARFITSSAITNSQIPLHKRQRLM